MLFGTLLQRRAAAEDRCLADRDCSDSLLEDLVRPRLGERRGAASFPPVLLLLCVFAAPSFSQEEPDARRRARVLRCAVPPTIDGLLEPEVWGAAEPIGELVQVEPLEGAAPSERSDIRLLYDRDHLYIGLRLLDSQPEAIVTTTRERDAFLDADDRVEIVIDTFLDRRNAYFFQINAGGSEGDALVTNNGRNFNKPWDGIWEGKARVDDEGWTAEIRLPFKTLNFREGLTTWGFNIERTIGRRNERARWSSARQNQSLFNLFRAGDITGLTGIEQGIGLDLKPFFVGRWEDDGAGDQDLLGHPGLDAFYKLTPDLTLALTYNTDFAETEVDQRRVNLTRFPLFFPEQRDFFLQDAGLFEFASGLGTQLVPFFSRRIGLAQDGQEVPLFGGAKLTGRAGPWNVGLLDVQTEALEELDDQNLFAARVARNVGQESTMGAIVTSGDPAGGDNTLVGLDYNYRTSELGGRDETLTASVFALLTDSDDADGDEYAWGANVSYPNDRWSWFLGFLEIQPGFEPALGFVPRRDIRRYDTSLAFQPRPGGAVRQLEFRVDSATITDTADELETARVELQPLGIEWESGDAVRLVLEGVHDELEQDFEIREGVVIPIGEYEYGRARGEFESAIKRNLSLIVNVAGGAFFDGRQETYLAELAWQPGPLFRGAIGYELNEIHLEAGEFDTRVAFLDADFAFTPDLSWNSVLQWDNVSNTYGIQSRLRYLPEPGREWILVWNEALVDEGERRFEPLFQELAFKVSYTIRF